MQKVAKTSISCNISGLSDRYKSVIRFAVVGCLNTGVDFLAFTLLHYYFGYDKLICQIAGYGMGIINSFLLNKLWTFENRKAGSGTIMQAVRFTVINMLSLAISLLGLKFITDSYGLNIYASKVIVTIVAQVINYTGYKLWVFGRRSGL